MGVVADIADRVAVMYAGRIAETGPADAVFAAPRHPYTALLLAALPRLSDVPKSALAVIPGRVPAAGEFGRRLPLRLPLPAGRCAVPREAAAAARSGRWPGHGLLARRGRARDGGRPVNGARDRCSVTGAR